ncbi:gasdermin-E-like [Myxocyprinus asiaticus]|uniref:gasdermin-E-like n=1 Tax=Myxocyprinus asiaticus TaxID=70543 RepID=UPI0022224DEA|nr:gasdermin-E-like [Myxocyprinus asiaticus]
MFAKATKNLLSEIDTDGTLIPVSRLNDSDSLVPLALVIKRYRFWFWQRPKYRPTDFKLSDVLVGDPISPVVVETDFLTYSGKVVDNAGGNVEAEIGPGSLNLGGSGSTKLQSLFGNLKKQEVDVQKLLQNSKSRVLDLRHSLVQQTREQHREVLAVVKERIITTDLCTVTEEVQERGICTGMFGLNKQIKVSVNDKGKPVVDNDSNVSLNIPPKTIIAYGVIELEVDHTGHYELCLLPDVKGGFGVDGPVKVKHAALVSASPVKTSNKLQKELEGLQGQFKVLSELPASTRSALFKQISLLLQNSAAISLLENALEDLCGGRQPDPRMFDETAALKPALQTTLKLVQKAAAGTNPTKQSNPSGQRQKPTVLTATHLLISSLEEMTDSTLVVLKSCCSYSTLQALIHLVQNMASNKKSSLKDNGLSVLADEKVFKKITELFGCCNVTLHKEKDSLVTEISKTQDRLPLMLCIAAKGLASIAPPV